MKLEKKTHASKLANSEFAIIWYISSAIDKMDHLKSQRHILSRPLETERTRTCIRKRTSKKEHTHTQSITQSYAQFHRLEKANVFVSDSPRELKPEFAAHN